MKKILFICGSLNQTTQMHQIASHLMNEYDCYFTPYYADGMEDLAARMGWLARPDVHRVHTLLARSGLPGQPTSKYAMSQIRIAVSATGHSTGTRTPVRSDAPLKTC